MSYPALAIASYPGRFGLPVCLHEEFVGFEELAKLADLNVSARSANLLLSFVTELCFAFTVVLDSDLHVIGEFCCCFNACVTGVPGPCTSYSQ